MAAKRTARVSLFDGHEIFIDRLQLPESLSPEEIESAVGFHIETVSPFSQEQLSCAFTRRGDAVWVFLIPHRLLSDERFDRNQPHEVIPAALPATLFFESIPAQEALLVHTGAATILFRREPASGEIEASACLPGSVKRLLTRYGLAEQTLPVWKMAAVEEQGRRGLVATFSREESQETVNVVLSPEDIRRGDLRPPEVREFYARSGRRMQNLQNALMAGAAVLAFALLGHLLLFGLSFLQRSNVREVERLALEALRVEEAQELVISLRRVGREGLQPFHWIAELNQIRPDAIYFTDAFIQTPNRLRLEGRSTTVSEINAFNARIRQIPAVNSAESNISSREGVVSFTIEADIDDRAPLVVARSTEAPVPVESTEP